MYDNFVLIDWYDIDNNGSINITYFILQKMLLNDL